MSTPSGGHAVHLTSSSREQQNGGGPNKNVGSCSIGPGGKLQPQQHLLSNHQPQLMNSTNEQLHQQLAGNVHASTHLHSHPDLDHRVMSSGGGGGGGGGHHGPPPPPPPKVEAMGMMDAWTRMPPQYAAQPTSLEPQFISSSPAAYYHAPVSPYGAAYAGIGGDTTHAAASWSNGSDVASYFGYPPGPPASADFHHPETMSMPGMFSNGYPAGTYGAPSNFGYSPFTPTHTAPGPAVSQDYTGWAPTTPHELIERGAHQKNPYGDYYSYDLIGTAPTPNMMAPTGAPLDIGGAPMTVGCDDRVKSLGNQMENLSIAPGGQSLVFGNSSREFEQQQRQVIESRPATGVDSATKAETESPKKPETPLHPPESSTDVVSNQGTRRDSNLRSAATKASAPSAVNEKAENNNNDDNFNSEDHGVNEVMISGFGPNEAPITNAQAFSAAAVASGRDSPAASARSESNQEPSTSRSPETGNQGENVESDCGTAATGTKASMSLSNWNWIDEEVKDWSASPPPPSAPATLPVLSDEVLSSNQNEDDRRGGDDGDVDEGDGEGCGGIDEQASANLLQDLIRKNNYNPSELDARIEGARFFVIKSYSEDDVHRSIKYSIWCSTEHGNKKLDQAFRDQKSSGASGPIYLFYSVNGSGHFCGMAQMTSSVDYDTMTGVWAQDKWKGKFSVKWIYVKDIPNPELRHIRLENNENKPVTNSRDTQEIPPEKGRQVLEIMHKYRHETSLFDDFVYYEDMEHKREAERENHHHTKDRNSPSSGARSAMTTATTFRNFPPKRKDYGDDAREGHPSNGNHHHHHHHRDNHHHHHHHRDNHHQGKDYHHRTDSREHSRNSAVSGARSFSGGGELRASGSNSGSYNHNRDSNSRGFGGGYLRGGETTDPPRSNNHVGRSFTNFRRNTDRDWDYTGNERTCFSNRYNTTVRNDSADWRS